jgi:hypothetical protein
MKRQQQKDLEAALHGLAEIAEHGTNNADRLAAVRQYVALACGLPTDWVLEERVTALETRLASVEDFLESLPPIKQSKQNHKPQKKRV